ncbi:hypothetical protein CMEL01_11143 [Colletotrichum melonis]|uniref:Uncharacterized protein n=1 Tax=Colletotrichum melonis TaxID=1209925 RepID=A0AAI9XXW4_9PEZI|nr:hypothetical protein CMEL01_11143 [Colletotrichum melonis]
MRKLGGARRMSLASGHALGTGPCRYGRLAVYAACACARRVCRTCVHQFCRSRKPLSKSNSFVGQILASASRVRRFFLDCSVLPQFLWYASGDSPRLLQLSSGLAVRSPQSAILASRKSRQTQQVRLTRKKKVCVLISKKRRAVGRRPSKSPSPVGGRR